jgi:hypothetical protein
MWRCVALVRTDVSEERIDSIIRVERMCELGTTLAVTGKFPEDWVLHIHRCEKPQILQSELQICGR